MRGLPVHAVGGATADAAQSAGFAVADTGEADVDVLLGSLVPGLKLLHLCGEDRIVRAGARQEITAIVVYRAREKAAPDLSGIDACVALIHSPRAGRRFAELMTNRDLIAIAAISPAAADAAGAGWLAVETAEAPNDDALLALAERLCNKRGA